MADETAQAISIIEAIGKFAESKEIKHIKTLNEDIKETVMKIHETQEKILEFMPIITSNLTSKRIVTDVLYTKPMQGEGDFFVLKKDGLYVLYRYREKASKLRTEHLKFIIEDRHTVEGLAKYISDSTKKNMFMRFFEILWDGKADLGYIEGKVTLGKPLPIKHIEYGNINETLATHYKFDISGMSLHSDREEILDFDNLTDISSLLSIQQHINLHIHELEKVKEGVHKKLEFYNMIHATMNEEFSLLMVALKI